MAKQRDRDEAVDVASAYQGGHGGTMSQARAEMQRKLSNRVVIHEGGGAGYDHSIFDGTDLDHKGLGGGGSGEPQIVIPGSTSKAGGEGEKAEARATQAQAQPEPVNAQEEPPPPPPDDSLTREEAAELISSAVEQAVQQVRDEQAPVQAASPDPEPDPEPEAETQDSDVPDWLEACRENLGDDYLPLLSLVQKPVLDMLAGAPVKVTWVLEENDGEEVVEKFDVVEAIPNNEDPSYMRLILRWRPNRQNEVVAQPGRLLQCVIDDRPYACQIAQCQPQEDILGWQMTTAVVRDLQAAREQQASKANTPGIGRGTGVL